VPLVHIVSCDVVGGSVEMRRIEIYETMVVQEREVKERDDAHDGEQVTIQ